MGNSICHRPDAIETPEKTSLKLDFSTRLVQGKTRAVASVENQACHRMQPEHIEHVDEEVEDRWWGQSGGECVVYLERAEGVLVDLGALNCSCGDPPKRHTSVRAWAEELVDGVVVQVGRRVEWQSKPNRGAPRWYSARSLGFVLADHSAASLIVDLWDHASSSRLGGFSLPLASTRLSSPLVQDVEMCSSSMTSCTLTLQVLNSKDILQRRIVYFVRHAESVWNQAQSQMNFYEMGKTTDHPLTREGRRQAEKLRERVDAVPAATADDQACAHRHAKEISNPDVVFVSPLTRAIQSAAIALENILNPGVDVVISANVREKQNAGGFDSMGQAVGPAILDRAYKELVALYDGETGGAAEKFAQLKFDIQEVEEQWWASSSESKEQVHSRVQEFMNQLVYSPHKVVIVVGHSHFFREVFRVCQSSAFQSCKPVLAANVSRRKLCNCGVARVVLDAGKSPEAPIVDVDLVFGTTLCEDERFSGLCKSANCCAGPPAASDL
eukprot:TRINITY_DN67376_c0_g1_i1.p1 TRINITY_DN67376_c0_g1~~TRINITY_DN67376_c0_g1_i1.p1  ORF type:complete len:498 (+),score=83.54 TRINITY_DN67376_c0_g1_i1:65-1558(+)